MKRYNKKIILFTAIILILSMFTWYLTPTKKNISTSLCSMDGDQINVTFNINWHRHITRPTELWGTITIDEIVYYSIHETNTIINDGKFLDKLIKKLRNETLIQWFVISTNNAFDIHNNNIQIIQIDRDFNTVYITVVRDGILTAYYGPAETAKEANVISSRLNMR
jgi:hypothetical protein